MILSYWLPLTILAVTYVAMAIRLRHRDAAGIGHVNVTQQRKDHSNKKVNIRMRTTLRPIRLFGDHEVIAPVIKRERTQEINTTQNVCEQCARSHTKRHLFSAVVAELFRQGVRNPCFCRTEDETSF